MPPPTKDKFGNYTTTDANGFSTSSASPITAQSLAPATPITVPPKPTDTTNYAGEVAGTQAVINAQMPATTATPEVPTTPAPTKEPSAIESFLSGLKAPGSQTEAYKTAYDTSGLPTAEQDILDKQKVVKTAQGKLSTVNAQLAAIEAESKQQLLQLQGQGRGQSIDFLNRQASEISKQSAIRALPLQAQALAAQAEVQSAQGDVELAQNTMKMASDRLTTLFNLQSKDIENEYNYNKDLRDKVYEYATAKEKAQLDKMNKEDDRAFELMKDNINNAQTLSKAALDAGQADLAARITQLDPKSKTYTQDLAALQAEIKPDTTDKTYKQLQIKKLQQELGGGAMGESPLVTALKQNPKLYNDLTPGEKAKVIPELQASGFDFPRELNATQQTASQNAQSALMALSTLEGNIFDSEGGLNRTALTAAATGFGGTAAARREVIDVISRIRTGAALTQSEEAFYKKQVPNITDSAATAKQKVQQLTAFYAGIAGSPITIKSPEGKLYQYKDMFDSNNRTEVRKALSSGYTIADY